MEPEEVQPVGTLTFNVLTVAIAKSNNAMDQVSVFPHLPACTQDAATPQFFMFTSSNRGHLFVKENMGILVEGRYKQNVNKELTWNIMKVAILRKKGYPDQIVLHTDLPACQINPNKKATAAFVTEEGVAEKYAQEVLKLPYEVMDIDEMQQTQKAERKDKLKKILMGRAEDRGFATESAAAPAEETVEAPKFEV